jgi:hypothetical protein
MTESAGRARLVEQLRELSDRCRLEAFAECSLAEAVEGAMREAADILSGITWQKDDFIQRWIDGYPKK